LKPNSLTRYLKFVPLLAIFAFGVTMISLPKHTEATPLGAPMLSLTLIPLNTSTVVTAMYVDDTPAGSGSAVLSSTAAIGTFAAGATVTPAAGDGVEVVTVSGNTVSVTEDLDTLATNKTITATFLCTIPGATTFTITHGGITSTPSVILYCGDPSQVGGYQGGYYPGGYGAGYPGAGYPNTQYPLYGTTSAVTVSASPSTTQCTDPATISISVRDAAGNMAPNGTSVTVSASTGTVSPNVASTSGGMATATFTAPANSNGVATVTATSGTGTGYATVSFSCTSASTTAPASPVYLPPNYSSYPQGPVSIMPPNTGDAGLAQNASSTTTAGYALVALSVIGLTAGGLTLARQRAER
jgi:hypothetical protein